MSNKFNQQKSDFKNSQYDIKSIPIKIQNQHSSKNINNNNIISIPSIFSTINTSGCSNKKNNLIKCSINFCSNHICIECLTICNYCNNPICSIHNLTCINCKEKMCNFHWFICNLCQTNKNQKLCLKNCLRKCDNCTNEINVFCKEKNHLKNFVKKYNCNHYLCNECILKCYNCKIIYFFIIIIK